MSTTIDQRVVEMRFDNRQFESNVKTSLSTIDKLKQSLNFSGAAKGLDSVNDAAKRITFSGLGRAVESVHAKFSALEVVGVTALANITNSAVNAGKRIVSALTIDPIITGFQEYETQINAVQTILANTQSKGTTLTEVNAALDELNTYADQTIYNFTEMTRNIGTFTAAGVDLDKSVTSIKGIANLAAVSGSNAQQASTAMYQLSQALAAGKVSLMDWNSVVNAGMGGELFQNALIRTAQVMGTGVDQAIEKYGTFRESLTKGQWLTAEVLTETLSQLSGAYTEADLIAQGYSEEQAKEIAQLAQTAVDAATKVKTFTQLWDTLKEAAQSGWTQTWEILIGDFEESKALLTELSETFGELINQSAESRNTLLYDTMTSNWKKITDGITEAGLSAEDFKTKIEEIGKAKVKDFEKIVEDAGSLEAAFKSGALSSDLLDEALTSMTGTTTEISKEMKKLQGNYTNNASILNALAKKGYEYNDILELHEKNLRGEQIALNDLTDEQLLSIGYNAEQIQSIRQLSENYKLASGSLSEFIDNVSVQQGREMIIDVIRVSLRDLISIFERVGQAWRDVFPPTTAEQLLGMVKSFRDFAMSLRPSEETLDKLYRTFRGLFSILSIGKEAIFAVAEAFGSLLGNFEGLGGGILDVTASFGDWLYNLDQTIKKTGVFKYVMQGMADVIQFVIDAIKNFVNRISSTVSELDFFNNLWERIQTRMEQVGDTADDMGTNVVEVIKTMGEALVNSKFMQAMNTLWDGVKTVFGGFIRVLKELGSAFSDIIGDINFDGFFDLLNTAALGGVAIGITKFLNALKDPIDGVGGILENLVGILDGVRGCFEAYQTQLQAGTLIKIATAIAILAASIVAISLIDSKKLSASLGAITVLFSDLMIAMAVFSKISGPITGVFKTTTVMLALSTSILILSGALKQIAEIDSGSMVSALLGIAGLAAVMVVAVKALGKGSSTIIKGATQMVIFAAAIKILASACIDLAQLDWNELIKGLVGVGGLLAGVSLFLSKTTFSGKSISTATGIVILSGAIKILASACKDFGQMNWDEITKGLVSIGVLLTEITLFTRFTANATNVISTGVAMIALGAAMKVFASAVKDFSGMNWDELVRGLTGMGAALAAVTVALRFMPKNMMSIGTGLVITSSSLLILAGALNQFKGMTWEEIGKGLAVIGGNLFILQAALKAMTGTLSGSAALLVAASALVVLAGALTILGGMTITEAVNAVLTMAAAITVLGVAGAVLGPLVPSILGLAGAFALVGVAVLAAGAGLLAAGAGISALAVGISGLALALAGGATAIAAGLAAIITGIAGAIPAIARELGEGIIVLAEVIAKGAPAIGEAVKALVLTLVDVLVECVPAIADGALALIAGVLAALAQYTPQIVDSIFQFLIGLLDGIAKNLPELIRAAVDVIAQFFIGIVDALAGIDTDSLIKLIAGVGLLSGMMVALSALSSLVPGAMAGVLGLGVLIAELALVLAAIGGLAQIPGLDWLINEGAGLLESIGNAIGSLVGGIIGGAMAGISGQFPKIGTDLSNFMTNIQPFIEGAKSIDPSVMDGAKALAETILILTAANILDSITSFITGGSSLTKFAEELVPFGTAMKEFSAEIAGIDGTLVQNAAMAGKALAEMAATIPNSGGLVSFFTGENDMAQFSSQLVAFGVAMKAYADAIAGVDSEAVVNSATAGKALTELATTVPNTGGLAGFFAGENNMDLFATQLVPFGVAMKAYSLAVAGLDTEAINNSMVAGEALVELANTVPYCGGLVSFFGGSNDIGTFGMQLVTFGQSFKEYSDYVKDIDPSVVTSTSNAAQSLVTLADSLPENSLFSSNTSLSDFGNQLRLFGQYMKSYYDNISGVNVYTLSSVISQTQRLVDLAQSMDGVNSKSMSNFGKALSDLGKAGIEDFISAFTNSSSRITEAASGLISNFTNGINARRSEFTTAFSKIIDAIPQTIKNKYREFYSSGQTLMVKFTDGMSSKQAAARSLISNVISSLASSIKSGYSSFYSAGGYLVQGFINGMESHMSSVRAAARRIAREAYEAAMDELDAYSPSRVFIKVGSYVAMGFANGMEDNANLVEDSSRSMADTAISTVSDTISRMADLVSSDIDVEPTIRPVLDLSDVESKTSRLNAMFSTSRAMTIGASMRQSTIEDPNLSETTTPQTGATFQFTQNNYSPKALSRVEIYRQTNNQFSAFERMVRA